MKTTLLIFTVLGVLMASNAFAAPISITCVNVARSAVTTGITMDVSTMQLAFGSGADKSEMEQDIKEKTLTLKLDLEGTSDAWIQYSGDVLVNSYFKDFRTIQARIERSTLNNKNFRMAMAISNQHGEFQLPYTFVSYGMNCTQSDN